jgi:hypothetical protein
MVDKQDMALIVGKDLSSHVGSGRLIRYSRIETADQLRKRLGWKDLTEEERDRQLESNLDAVCDSLTSPDAEPLVSDREARLQSLGFDPVSDEQRAANLHDILTGLGIY